MDQIAEAVKSVVIQRAHLTRDHWQAWLFGVSVFCGGLLVAVLAIAFGD